MIVALAGKKTRHNVMFLRNGSVTT